MNVNSGADITALLALLNHASTSQQTRADILQQLTQFKESNHAWRICCSNLSLSAATDASTAFFYLNTLGSICESVTRWKAIYPDGRREVRECLMVLSRMANDPALRRKACQVLVVIGKQEYAATWPEFPDFVCGECEQDRFDMILSCCEIFMGDMAVTSSTVHESQKGLFKRYLVERVSPKFVHVLTLTMYTFNPIAIKAVNAMVEWIPLNKLTVDFISRLVEVSAHPATASLGMTALAQLMDRNFYPPNAEHFVESVAKRVFEALATTTPELFAQDADLTNAVLMFVRSFTKRHLRKAEKYFSIPQFLEVFFSFTMNLKDLRYFLLALETWESFIESCQEYESSTNLASPYGAPVVGSLLWRLLERFLFCKSASPDAVRFLERLEDSQELIEEDEEDAGLEDADGSRRRSALSSASNHEISTGDELDKEECDWSFLVSKVIRLVQRAALLPVSSAASLGNILETSYRTIQQEAQKIGDSSSPQSSRHAARDVSLLLRVVSASSILFARQEFYAMPAITDLASWSLELIKMCVRERLWSRNPAFIELFIQSLHCALSFAPWAQVAQKQEFLEQCVVIGVETLKCQGCPEGPRVKAVSLLRAISPPTLWMNQLLSPTLYEFTADLTDFVRSRVYSTFALAVAAQNVPQLLQQALQKDLEIIRSLDVHRVKRSIQSMRAVVQSTSLRPETSYKTFIYQTVGMPLLESALGLLERNAVPRLVLSVLDTCFSLLRRQMGDETCGAIVGKCLDVYPRLDARGRDGVWGLLEKVVEENTKAFDNILGSVLDLILANSAAPSEMDEFLVRISRQLLVGHWHWLVVLQSPDRTFALANSLVKRVDSQYPPDIVRITCRAFVDAPRLLKNEGFKTSGLLAQLTLRAISLIASRERELIVDDLTDLVFSCAQADWEHFFGVVLPQMTAAAPPSTVAMIPLGPTMAKDQGSFQEALLTFCASASSPSTALLQQVS